MRRFNAEEVEFVSESAPNMTHAELKTAFVDRFGFEPSNDALYRLKSRLGVRSKTNAMKWTPEMDDFMREFVPGHMEYEIQDAFEKRFGIRLRISQIANRKNTLGVKSGTFGGRFTAGQKAWNKGLTWDEQGWPKESQERCRATQFKKGWTGGNRPSGFFYETPIGYERMSADGYLEVRVSHGHQDKPNTNFRRKHHLVWEEANGVPVPPNSKIIFADGDRLNFDPDNLVCIPNKLWSTIHLLKIEYWDKESLLLAARIAELNQATQVAMKKSRNCKRCGSLFPPRFPNQRTCDVCLGRIEAYA